MAESEGEKKADSLVGAGWEGHIFGRYKMGRILLEGHRGQKLRVTQKELTFRVCEVPFGERRP